MSEEFRKTLFEPFTRKKTSNDCKVQRNGLGMAIVKRYIDMMVGEIEVRTEPGKGTRIDINFDFRINNEAES